MTKEFLILHKHSSFVDAICTAKTMEKAEKLFEKFVEFACWNYVTEVKSRQNGFVNFTDGSYAHIVTVNQCKTEKDLKDIGYAL